MIQVKKGDTLSIIVRRKNEDGTPRTGEALKLRSQVRSSKELLLGSFTITETTTPGDYLFQIAATVTKDWPTGEHNCDIQYTDAGVVASSQTFKITVLKDVTRDE